MNGLLCGRGRTGQIGAYPDMQNSQRSRRYLKLLSMRFLAISWLAALVSPCVAEDIVIRVGHFPNLTHMQGLIAHNLSRQGKGWFEQRLGADVKVEWYLYNAGPSAMEAIFASSLDLTYVGPSPAINAYTKSGGEEIRIIAGAANGGSALVVQPDLPLNSAADFKGRTIATPQLGNTQDVAARVWLGKGGLKITLTGGDANVIPTANPDQLSLFKEKQLDAVWTVEPWVSRLESEAQGRVLLEEPKAVTTVLASSAPFLKDQRPLVTKFAAAHRELTEWIVKNPEEAQRLVRDELAEETRVKMAPELVARAWKRITVTSDIDLYALEHFVRDAQSVGFLRSAPDLGRLVERP
ncbi:ABC transporter substrate-binding protein [Mesorhizobium sp. M0276]|uniref:ABC transporter substrate-binding protein n=1 Tax=Mesorhizobium sp. M0276 TaxID=2956928 RepID=UPI003338D4B8